MLKSFFYEDKIQVNFDVPIGTSLLANEELNSFFRIIKIGKDVEVLYDDYGKIQGIRFLLDSLLQLTDDLLGEKEAGFQKKILSDLSRISKTNFKEGLDVNFHQNSFDNDERYWDFILNQGNFNDYFFNRINWFATPESEYVTDFPLHVDLESASTCNMHCPMCYRDQLKHTGQMDLDLFKKAVDECSENGLYSMRLSWRGETLTHPQIKEMISYACKKIKNVSFLTNAFYLDEDMIDHFIDAGVSYVAVSFDGVYDTYEKIRHPAKFQENYQRLKLLKEKKEEKKSKLPQVRVCTIWPAIKGNPQEYYDLMKDVSDYIVCNPYINFKGIMRIKEGFICQYPWERIVVGYNGDAQCCTGWNADDIILGNVKEKSIKNMWKSDRMNYVRSMHSSGKRMELSSCAECRHGSESDGNVSIDQILEREY